jgi:hypothetical protein
MESYVCKFKDDRITSEESLHLGRIHDRPRWAGRFDAMLADLHSRRRGEVRRNAATRSGSFDYRASAAQWHSDRAPDVRSRASLRPTLRFTPMSRNALLARSPAWGIELSGPDVAWKGRRAVHRQSRLVDGVDTQGCSHLPGCLRGIRRRHSRSSSLHRRRYNSKRLHSAWATSAQGNSRFNTPLSRRSKLPLDPVHPQGRTPSAGHTQTSFNQSA